MGPAAWGGARHPLLAAPPRLATLVKLLWSLLWRETAHGGWKKTFFWANLHRRDNKHTWESAPPLPFCFHFVLITSNTCRGASATMGGGGGYPGWICMRDDSRQLKRRLRGWECVRVKHGWNLSNVNPGRIAARSFRWGGSVKPAKTQYAFTLDMLVLNRRKKKSC